MSQPELKNVEQRGKDLHADLPLRRQWIEEGREISVEIPGGRNIQVALNDVMTDGAILRLSGQALDSDGDLLLRICIADDGDAQTAATQTAAGRELRERKTGRRIMTLWAFGAGLVLIWGFEGWRINGVPAAWIGYLCIAIGVLSLLGFNPFRGGPLDKRRDPPEVRPPANA
jgi:hypothetical protein